MLRILDAIQLRLAVPESPPEPLYFVRGQRSIFRA